MATPAPSPNPIYHDPTQTRRRSSSRRSVASLSRSASHFESARTACPKDGDAFSYNPAHLRNWYVPQELWDRLSAPVQSSLAAVQHAGAAVLTGKSYYLSCNLSAFSNWLAGARYTCLPLGHVHRLEKHTENFDVSRADGKAPIEELLVQLDDLPPARFRTVSNAGSVFHSDTSSPPTNASSASESGCPSPVMSSTPMSQVASPASPICLGPPELSDNMNRGRERSFSTPLQPHDAYYATELSHLRTEALPRLRHKSYKVDTEWYEAKRQQQMTEADINAFEAFWREKKLKITALNEQGKRLASAVGLANTGLGWCAP
ncbi:hypothetical protein BDW02DRAFT_563006 [Decorospora gaudefroyi]|uniref:Uncharacterized protein n=1 Tax=Decorospora gaudefroyi TaxID=184978 RepID=A0A6A5JYC8_9PLEO|nr:hypothetical protein BDW02DRAFT_563006 [Decorospora gaudefroyi]